MYMHVYSHVFDVWFHNSNTVVYTMFLKLSECKKNPRKQVIVKKNKKVYAYMMKLQK